MNAVDYASKEKIQFYSAKSMYHIRVVAITEAQFYVRFDREGSAERIFEGYPVTINFTAAKPTIIQFVNSQQLDKPVTLMANIDEMDTSSGLTPSVNFDLIAQL